MRISQLAAIALAGIALAGSAMSVAQSSNLIDRSEKVNGYVDLKTGLFHPATERAANPETTPTFKTFASTVEVVITATINAATAKEMPKGSTIICDVNLNGYAYDFVYSEVAASPATISGDTATCTVNVPYNWTGETGGPAADYYFNGTYKLTASYAPGGATQPLTDFNVIRQTTGILHSSTGIVNFPLPATSTTIKIDVDALL
jgi:hypothetical protein